MSNNNEPITDLDAFLAEARAKPFDKLYAASDFGGGEAEAEAASVINSLGLMGRALEVLASDTGGSLADRMGLDEEQLQAINALAIRRYQAKQYQEAADLFAFLAQFDLLEAEHFKHWGACLQQMEDYEGAIRAYSAAIGIDPMDPVSQFHMAQCWTFEGDFEKAQGLLNGATIIIKHYPGKYDHIVQQVEALKAIIKAATNGGGNN